MSIGDRSHVSGIEQSRAGTGNCADETRVNALDHRGTPLTPEQQRGRSDSANVVDARRPRHSRLKVERQFVDATRRPA